MASQTEPLRVRISPNLLEQIDSYVNDDLGVKRSDVVRRLIAWSVNQPNNPFSNE